MSPDNRIQLPKRDVQRAFKHVFLYDFGVLFYFFASLAACWWSVSGFTWLNHASSSCGSEGDGAVASSRISCMLALFVGWIALVYTSFWFCCECCAKSVELEVSSDGHDIEAVVQGSRVNLVDDSNDGATE